MSRHRAAIAGATTALLVAAVMVIVAHNAVADAGANALTGLDLSLGNRRVPISGLYDWSKAGYRGGANLPGAGDITSNQSCVITPSELDTQYNVRGGDGVDDTTGIQAAIDAIRTGCSASAGFSTLSLITLPAGILNVSREIHVDADYLIIRGAGSGAGGTRLVYRPDANTAYDTLTPDGSDWDEDGMTHGQGKGGWLWPGRGLFRVQSRGVHTSYASDYASAPANRKDIFEGTVNVHWKAGLKLRAKPGDIGFAARLGDTVVYLDSAAVLTTLAPGKLVNIRAANSMKFYEQQQALPTTWPLQNLHMRQQIFTIASVDATNKTITLNKPLEYDVPVDSTSDGSTPIEGAVYLSKASPLIDPVVGVGFENLSFTQDMPGLNPANAVNNYGNMSPANEMHGIVFKWAADSWVRGVKAEMTGSHPIVTEEAYHLQIVNNELDGSWNKGKGGNGYFRGSRVWDTLYAGNTSRNLRHFTFQWSASGNVVIGNDSDSDLNLHGGWERNNLFELNTTRIPYQHRSGSCTANCGEEGGGAPDASTWFPIWWGAGKKAVKWSGSSGPRNVFFNNTMTKQATSGGAYIDYYADHQRIYQFGWSGTAWKHLDVGGTSIPDWAGNEQGNFTAGHGVDATKTSNAPSLFLNNVAGAPTTPPTTSSPTASPTSSPTASPTPPGPGVRYEAENATIFHGTIDSNHAGFSGTGFANPANEVGSYVQWQVNAAQVGPAKVDIRYANGTTVSRPMDITVNGSLAVDEHQFPGTGTWPNWQTRSVNLTLAAGANTIRLTSTIATGGPNLDYIEVGTAGGNEVLLSRGKPATASSVEAATLGPEKAFDGVGTTRWASAEGSDPQWIRVDLGANSTVTRIVLTWEAAYASGYQIQTSPDDTTWTNVYSTTTGDGGTDTITGLDANTRYVRMHGTTRATAYGYSLWEMDVYGTRS